WSSGNVIEGNYIGPDITGMQALGNGRSISLFASNNMVGGTVAGAGNVISGNSSDGIHILSGAIANLIEGTYVGTDTTGAAALPNSGSGVEIDSGASGNTIGGATAAARNIISGNQNIGIYGTGSSNLVEGNYIGTDVTGQYALGNSDGVWLSQGASRNTII